MLTLICSSLQGVSCVCLGTAQRETALGTERQFPDWKSCRSTQSLAERQVTGTFLPDAAKLANVGNGRSVVHGELYCVTAIARRDVVQLIQDVEVTGCRMMQISSAGYPSNFS